MMNETSGPLQRLRNALPAILAERDALPPDSVFQASEMWRGFTAFNFIFDLSDQNLRDIRIHTSLMTGMSWFRNMGAGPFCDDEHRLSHPMIRAYHELTRDVPERFWAGEPAPTPLTESMGIRYKGHLVTDDSSAINAVYPICIGAGFTGGSMASPGAR